MSGNGIAAVAALAGRRIDASGAQATRFPREFVPQVKSAIAGILYRERLRMLVCSAACGADLLGLQAAQELNIRCRVILPYGPGAFRNTSVIDRPGDWGLLFDRAIDRAQVAGDLVILAQDVGSKEAYRRATDAIISETIVAAKGAPALAIMVWDGQRHSADDATAEFRRLAVQAGLNERAVMTHSAQ